MQKLLLAGANIHERDNYGFTPLFQACWAPLETFKTLVQLDADTLATATDGGTLLHAVAYGSGRVEVQ